MKREKTQIIIGEGEKQLLNLLQDWSLISRGKIIGVLEVFHRQEFSPTSAWFRLFRNLAEQVSHALDIPHLAEK